MNTRNDTASTPSSLKLKTSVRAGITPIPIPYVIRTGSLSLTTTTLSTAVSSGSRSFDPSGGLG